MRVLHVVATGERRGAEQFACDLASALAGTGIEQRVAILRGGDGTRFGYVVPVVALGPAGWRLPGLRIDPRITGGLRHVVANWRPHIAQAHGGEALKYAIAAGATRVTSVVYRRIGGAPPRISRGLRRGAYGILMRRAARVVCVAEVLRREAISSFGLSPSCVVTIPNAVDGRRLRPGRDREETRRALGVPSSAPVLLSVGALVWEKDPIAHLDIAARVLRAMPDVLHLVVGNGPMRAAVDSQVRRLGLDGRVQVLGSRNDVADLLAASDVLLVASRTEGMPGVVIEAGMTGVPVAGFAIGGVPEVVRHGVTGWLVPAGDLDGLAHGVVDLLRNVERRREMGDAARERCHASFDISAIAPRYLRLYEELVNLR